MSQAPSMGEMAKLLHLYSVLVGLKQSRMALALHKYEQESPRVYLQFAEK